MQNSFISGTPKTLHEHAVIDTKRHSNDSEESCKQIKVNPQNHPRGIHRLSCKSLSRHLREGFQKKN